MTTPAARDRRRARVLAAHLAECADAAGERGQIAAMLQRWAEVMAANEPGMAEVLAKARRERKRKEG